MICKLIVRGYFKKEKPLRWGEVFVDDAGVEPATR